MMGGGVNEVSGVMYESRYSGKEAVPVMSDFGPNGLQGCPGLGDHPQSFLLVSETWKYTYKASCSQSPSLKSKKYAAVCT